MEHKCSHCVGSGIMTCYRCGGTGKFGKRENCYYCKGRGVLKCAACNGTGKVKD